MRSQQFSGYPWLPKAALACTATAGLALLLAPSELLWWLINFAGVASFILFGSAAVIVPGPGMVHPARRYVLHVRLSRWAVALALIHALAIPLIDSSIWLYATRSIPLDILLGLIALAALLAAAGMREPLIGAAALAAARPAH